MASTYIISVATAPKFDDWARGAATVLKQSAGADRIGTHTLTDDPDSADIILFAEMNEEATGAFMENIAHHPLYRKYPEKSFLYWPGDFPLALLPGIYCSISRAHQDKARSRSGPYLTIMPNPFVDYRPLEENAPHLFSFRGAISNHPVRASLLHVLGEQSRGIFGDVSKESNRITMSGTAQEREQFWRVYADMMADSKFVLCPRGVGANSIRLFESMKMGRVPVIISDDWVAPLGPDWDSFCLRIAEKDIPNILSHLTRMEPMAETMGKRAREQWETFFGPDVVFHYFVEQCVQMQQERKLPQVISRWLSESEKLRPVHLRRRLRMLKDKLVRK